MSKLNKIKTLRTYDKCPKCGSQLTFLLKELPCPCGCNGKHYTADVIESTCDCSVTEKDIIDMLALQMKKHPEFVNVPLRAYNDAYVEKKENLN